MRRTRPPMRRGGALEAFDRLRDGVGRVPVMRVEARGAGLEVGAVVVAEIGIARERYREEGQRKVSRGTSTEGEQRQTHIAMRIWSKTASTT